MTDTAPMIAVVSAPAVLATTISEAPAPRPVPWPTPVPMPIAEVPVPSAPAPKAISEPVAFQAVQEPVAPKVEPLPPPAPKAEPLPPPAPKVERAPKVDISADLQQAGLILIETVAKPAPVLAVEASVQPLGRKPRAAPVIQEEPLQIVETHRQ